MVEQIVDDDKTPTTVIQDLVQLDAVFDKAQKLRLTIAEKLEKTLNEIEFAATDSKLLESQMTAVNAYRGLLGDLENNAGRRVNSKIKQKEAENSSKHNIAVAEFLSKINSGSINVNTLSEKPFNRDEAEQNITDAFDKAGLAPILETELLTDPKAV